VNTSGLRYRGDTGIKLLAYEIAIWGGETLQRNLANYTELVTRQEGTCYYLSVYALLSLSFSLALVLCVAFR